MRVRLKKADKPCIVVLGESQQISKYPEGNIEALLCSHIQHLSNVRFIFLGSGCHLVTEMSLSSACPLYNNTSTLELYPIIAGEYIPFVCHWFDVYGRTTHEEDVSVIYRLLEGNTYYMQKTFHEVLINTPIDSSCTSDVLWQTVGGVLEGAGDGYHQLLSRVPERQKELLYAIASAGKAEKVTSVGFIRKYSLISSNAVQAATRKLVKLGLLTEEDNIYFIPDILLRMYLQRLKNTNIILVPS